ncbi:condensation domain-containing protein [Streptomyces sp. M10(2022)]
MLSPHGVWSRRWLLLQPTTARAPRPHSGHARLRCGRGRLRQVPAVRAPTHPANATQERLTEILQAMLDHHDILRASLAGAVGDRSLDIAEPGTVQATDRLERIDASGMDHTALREAVTTALHHAQELLDPSAGVLVRAAWFDAGSDTPGRLLLVLHHLVADGVSWRILLSDLATAWQAVTNGQEITLPPTGTSFRRWAQLLTEEAQNPKRFKELPLWSRILQHPEPTLGGRP